MELIRKIINRYNGLALPLKAGLWFTFASFMQRGLTMITTPIFTRLLSKDQYGLASTYSAWYNVLTLLVTLSLYKSMMNLYKKYTNMSKVATSVSSLSIVVSSLWVILGILFSRQLSRVFGMTQVLTIGLFISFIPQAIINCWSIEKRYKYEYKICVIQSLVTVVGSTFIAAFCVVFISPSAESKTLPTVIVTFIVSVIIYVLMLRRNSTFYDKEIWKFAMSFCIALLPHYLSEFVLQSSDKLMINTMCGVEDVAVYSIAYSVGSLITLVISAVNNTLIPYRYQRLVDKKYERLSGVTNKSLLLVSLLLCGIMLMSPEIIYIFGGKQYEEAKYLVIPICLGVYFNFVFQMFSTVQEFYEKKWTVVTASILCAVFNIILNYIFIKIYDYQAAAYTTFFCYMLFSFIHYLFYKKVCINELKGAVIYDIKSVFIISIITIVMGIIISFINFLIYVKYILAFIICGILVYMSARYKIKKG